MRSVISGDPEASRLPIERTARGFTLVELLIVVAVIGILVVIAVPNYLTARERAWKAADAANLRTIGVALQAYYADFGGLPPADREAGPFKSHSIDFTQVGNGPAAGGSWDGLPWLLYELEYVREWETLFCPKYLRLYKNGNTLREGHPRFHNFRYAYNSSALSTGGHLGGSGILTGTVWMVRDLYVAPQNGWYGGSYPGYPADYRYPWGEGKWEDKLELVMYADFSVQTRIGGTDIEPDYPETGP